jgi:hypothetical protein
MARRNNFLAYRIWIDEALIITLNAHDDMGLAAYLYGNSCAGYPMERVRLEFVLLQIGGFSIKWDIARRNGQP